MRMPSKVRKLIAASIRKSQDASLSGADSIFWSVGDLRFHLMKHPLLHYPTIGLSSGKGGDAWGRWSHLDKVGEWEFTAHDWAYLINAVTLTALRRAA